MGTFTRGPMWLQLAQHLLLFWLIHYSDATPFKEPTEIVDPSSLGCYYNYNHYSEGDRILTNEPCLNCTCHNKMLMCYLRVCPFTKPIGQDCTIEKREDQCCPIITCPEVPVELVDHSSGLHPTSLAMPDRYGCHINNQFYAEGSQIPSNPKKPCELCYCIRNMTSCVMQECTLHVEGCSPIYNRDVCCPVRYDCGRESMDELLLEESTTTVRPTPGFMLTTTMIPEQNHCVHNNDIYNEGEVIETDKPCEHCYCMRGDIVCAVQECSAQLENRGKQCKPRPPQEGQCCPDTYDCDMEGETTEESLSLTTVESIKSTDITPTETSTESDNINEIEDEGLTKPLPITEHIDEFDKTTISPLVQRFDATGESSTKSILEDMSKLQDKLEITTMFYTGFDEDIDINTVIPHIIPGEGSCLIDGVTYRNNSRVPASNKCDKSCVCLNSVPQCISLEGCTPDITATEGPVSETERSTEAITETPTSATKSLAVEDENITELIAEVEGIKPTEKELSATEQPEPSASEQPAEVGTEKSVVPLITEQPEEEPSASEKPAEEGTEQPAGEGTEKSVVSLITEQPEETLASEKPAEEGTEQLAEVEPSASEKPAEEGTEQPAEVEPSASEKPAEEGTEQPSEVEPSASEKPAEEGTEQPAEVEPSASEKPTEEGTEQPPAEVEPSASEKPAEEGTEQPAEVGTEKSVVPLVTEQPEEPSAATEQPAEAGTEEPLVGTEQPAEVATEKSVETYTTEQPRPSAATEQPAVGTMQPAIAGTEEPSAGTEEPAEVATEKSVGVSETEGPSAVTEERGAEVTEQPKEKATEKETEPSGTTVASVEGVTETTEKLEISSEKELETPEELGTRVGDIEVQTTSELPIESHVTHAPQAEAEQITEKEAGTTIAAGVEPEAGTERASATEVSATSKPLKEEEQIVTEKGTTSAAIEEGTTKTSPVEGETESPIVHISVATQEAGQEQVQGATEESVTATQKPSFDEEHTVVSESATEKGISSEAPEEGTTKETRPSESATEKVLPEESVSEPSESTGATEESILATQEPLSEETISTISPSEEIEKEKTPEGTTLSSIETETQKIDIISPPQTVAPQQIEAEAITTQKSLVSEEEETSEPAIGTPASEKESEGIQVTTEPSSAFDFEVTTLAEPVVSGVETVTSAPLETAKTVQPLYVEHGTQPPTQEESTELPAVEEVAVTKKIYTVGQTEEPETASEISSEQPDLGTRVGEIGEQTTSLEGLKPADVSQEGVTLVTLQGEHIPTTETAPAHIEPEEATEPEGSGATEESVSTTEKSIEVQTAVPEKGTTTSPQEEGSTKAPEQVTETSAEEEGVSKPIESGVTEVASIATEKSSAEVPTEAPQTVTEMGSTSVPLYEATTIRLAPSETAETEKVPETQPATTEVPSTGVTESQQKEAETSTETLGTLDDRTGDIGGGYTKSSAEVSTETPQPVTEMGSTSVPLYEATTIRLAPSETAETEKVPEIQPATTEVPSTGVTESQQKEAETSTETLGTLDDRTGDIGGGYTAAQGLIPVESHVTEKGPTTEIVSEEVSTTRAEGGEGLTEKSSTEKSSDISHATEISATQTPLAAGSTEQTEKGTTAGVEEGTTKISAPSETEVTEAPIVGTEPSIEIATEAVFSAQKPEEVQTNIPEIITERSTTLPALEEGTTVQTRLSEEITEKPVLVPEETASEPAEGTGVTEENVSVTQEPLSSEVQTKLPEEGTTKQGAGVTEESILATQTPLSEESEAPEAATEKVVSEESVSEPATEAGLHATQKPTSQEGPTEVSESVTDKGTEPSEEGTTKESPPKESVTEESLVPISATEEGYSATLKPIEGITFAAPEEGITKESRPLEGVTEETVTAGSGATDESVSATQKPVSEDQTEVSELATEKSTTFAAPAESTTKETRPSDIESENIIEEYITKAEGITEKVTSVPSVFADVTTEKLEILEEENVSEPVTVINIEETKPPAQKAQEEPAATERPEDQTTKVSLEEATEKESEVPEELGTRVGEIEAHTTSELPIESHVTHAPEAATVKEPVTTQTGVTEVPVTQKEEEGQTEASENISEPSAVTEEPVVRIQVAPQAATQEPVESGTGPSVLVTQIPEEQTEIAEGTTKESLPSEGITSATTEEATTKKSRPVDEATEKLLPEELTESAEKGISGTSRPSEASTEAPESITEKATTSEVSQEVTTKQSRPSDEVTEESASEPTEGLTGRPLSEEVSTVVSEIATEKATAAEEEVTRPSEEGTEKPIAPVRAGFPQEVTESQPEVTEPITAASPLEEGTTKQYSPSEEVVTEGKFEGEQTTETQKITTILDIIRPPQLAVHAETGAPITTEKPSEEEGSERPVSETEGPSAVTEEKGAEVTEQPIEKATEKETEPSGTTVASVEGVTETTEKLEISSEKELETPEELGTRVGDIEVQTASELPIESHVTHAPQAEGEQITEKEAGTTIAAGVEPEAGTESTPATEVSATAKPLKEEEQIVTEKGTTSAAIEEGTTKTSPIEGETESPIVPISVATQEAGQEQVQGATEESVTATQKPSFDEEHTVLSESATEKGISSEAPEEGTTKETRPSESATEKVLPEEGVSEPSESIGATEESILATQKPLSEETISTVSPSEEIEKEKTPEGTTLSSIETETQKITTIFDIISPPQTVAPQQIEAEAITTQKSLVSEEEETSEPAVGTETIEVTRAPALEESATTEKIAPEQVATEKDIEAATQKAEEEVTQKGERVTQEEEIATALPGGETAAPTEKITPEHVQVTEAAEGTTEKEAEGVTPAGETLMTESPMVIEIATEAAGKESDKIIEEYITKATEATTLSAVDFEQKLGEDNKTESLPDLNKMTTILDIISPTKAPAPSVQREDVSQTTTVLPEEEKEIAITTEKAAVTEKAPSVEQTTLKPSTSSEPPVVPYGGEYEQPGTSHYPGQTYLEEDYGDEEDQTAFGPGTCRYGGKLYVSAQQIPRDDPCDFCFCFRSDIICLQQSCPPPITGCHEEPIQGFCCPRYECPVSMATVVNVTTSTTTTSTTLPPHFLHHAYKGAATKSGCQIDEHTYQVGDVVPSASGPCMHCICGGDGQMKCDPKQCTPEPMLRQMIAITSRR